MSFSGAVRALEFYLMGVDGMVFDHYREDEHYTSWHRSIFRLDRLESDPAFADFRRALENGETQWVEFKEWIAANPRDTKSYELLKTACAFANADGGQLLIGIDDEGGIIGTKNQLQKTYGKTYSGDLTKMQDAYVKDLRKILMEGISPSITPVFTWIDHAGKNVLQVVIPRGIVSAYHIVETGDTYVRKGATNRKAGFADLERMFETRGSL